MEQSYAISAWFFTRALSLVYLIAFASLFVQAKGLWGKEGVMPIEAFHKAVEKVTDHNRYWEMPSVFWLSASDSFITAACLTGAAAALLALVGCAQGWSLLLCFVLYLSFCSSGQEFMTFQWDTLLLEVGFVVLFAVPWNFDFTLLRAVEPHWIVRAMFYILLFKLMFLSGAVKLLSGDESWRDLTALSYHYWTQPLPNPLSPFMHALPLWFHRGETILTFAIELGAPFFIFWPRARIWAAAAFISLSLMIFLTGNYTFFNLLTIALCFWLIPDGFWERILPLTMPTVHAQIFPHPFTATVMVGLALLSLFWCTRFWLPGRVINIVQPILQVTQAFHISNPYGLFATMTKSRSEIVLEGSADGKEWKEYQFRYKPGDVSRPPPIVAPHQPRLDWQMWFAALGSERTNPWVHMLIQRMLEGSPAVLNFFSENPFASAPPKYIRAKLYAYDFNDPGDILSGGNWWVRRPLGDYTGTMAIP